jgi:hypothetical protein
VRDVRLIELAGRQFDRVSRRQLLDLGFSEDAVAHRLDQGRFVRAEEGVIAIAPMLEHDEWGRWMAATLTAPDTFLSHYSAAAARGFWELPRHYETVTRPGSGGPRKHGAILVFRSSTLAGDCEVFQGIPVTTVARTVLDLSARVSERAIARAVRDTVRDKLTDVEELADAIGRHRGRRGSRRLATVLARYTGLPIRRARSGAEVRALEVLRSAGRPAPRLNVHIAGEEADLSWPRARMIVEIDGGPFHLDVGEDARKQARWEAAGWTVSRISSDDVYEHPERLLAIAPH